MKKAVFGSVLTFLISMIFAVLALVLVWNILEKVFGFSAGILLGAVQKYTCDQFLSKIPGGKIGQTVAGVGAGGAAGAGIGAIAGCGIAGGVAAVFTVGIAAVPACILGAKIGGALGGVTGSLVGGFTGSQIC